MSMLWLALLLQAPASAATPSACVVKTSSSTYQEPASLRALLDCQKKKMAHLAANYQKQHRQEPSDETVSQWEERQRAEVRAFLQRHPNLATLDEGNASDDQAEKPQPQGKSGKTDAVDMETLKQDLWEKSDQGRNGITPDMAQEIIGAITGQQGFVSPDMTALLDAVQKDGAKLTDDTVNQLKAAAQKATASGLDLGVQPDIQKFLLQQGDPKDIPDAQSSPGTN
jgi:hypothetical protein